MQYLAADWCAICRFRRRFLQAGSAQTTTDGWLALDAAPKLACRSGSALFCFDGTQGVKYQLDDAVVTQRRQCDQLRRSSNNNPKSRMREKFHVSRQVAVLPA
jgi:hypothetical protein